MFKSILLPNIGNYFEIVQCLQTLIKRLQNITLLYYWIINIKRRRMRIVYSLRSQTTLIPPCGGGQ